MARAARGRKGSNEMPRQKVEFSPNVPTQVVPDGFGTLQESTSGAEEYRYMLAGDRIMWVPPAVHQYIAAAQKSGNGRASNGEVFTITKMKAGKAAATWQVELSNGHGYGTASPTAAPPEPPMERTPQGYRQAQPAQTAPHRFHQPPPAPPQPAAQLASEAHAGELAITAADRMAAALAESLQLWSQVTQAAAELRMQITPNAGDVRATACALFIDGGRK